MNLWYSSAATSHVQMRALFSMLSSPGAVLGVNDMSACRHSAWVISIHSISFACCVVRSGGSSGRSAGAGRCVSRNTWHFSSGVTALCCDTNAQSLYKVNTMYIIVHLL